MIVVSELEKTCDACPAQWEGRTVDGAVIYVRYRHGYLGIGVGADLQEAVERAMDREVRVGGDGLGCMEANELEAATVGKVHWPWQ